MAHRSQPAPDPKPSLLKRLGGAVALFAAIFAVGVWLLSSALYPRVPAPSPPPLSEVSITEAETASVPSALPVQCQNLMKASRPVPTAARGEGSPTT